ncbi:hypothetical protein ACFW24_37380 [Streptomyces nigra]
MGQEVVHQALVRPAGDLPAVWPGAAAEHVSLILLLYAAADRS